MIILKDLLSPIVPEKSSWKFQLLSEWHSIIGNLKATVTLEKIYEDTLILGVDNSSWMHELYLLSPMLISMINARIAEPRIKMLRFKLIARNKRVQNKLVIAKKNKTSQAMISNKEQQALETINDELLRKALYQFLMRCYQERV